MKQLAVVLLALVPALFGAGRRNVWVGPEDKVIPHIAVGGGWTTSITLVNVYSEPAQFNLRFWADNGRPLNVSIAAQESVSIVAATIPVGGTRTYDLSGGVTVTSGWAELDYDWLVASIGAITVFRQSIAGRPDFEAVVPVSASDVTGTALAFDNRNGFAAGVAFANPDNIPARYLVTFRDEDGKEIGDPVEVTLPAKGHTAFVLSERFSQVRNREGTAFIELISGKLTALGLRFNPSNAFTSTPARLRVVLSGYGGACGLRARSQEENSFHVCRSPTLSSDNYETGSPVAEVDGEGRAAKRTRLAPETRRRVDVRGRIEHEAG